MLQPIYEVCENETGYGRRGRCRETWWRQTAPREQLRATIENILAAARAQQQEYVSGSESRGWEEEVYMLGSEGRR